MKVAIEEPGKWERLLKVEVPAEDVKVHLEAVYHALNKRVSFPGFRKGKAPRHLIRARYGDSIKHEVLERAIPGAYREALDQEQLFAVSDPEFDRVEYHENEALCFEARVKVAPRVEPKGYKDLRLTMTVADIKEEDVDGNLQSLQERHADYALVEREAVAGDLVVVDYAPLDPQGEPADKWTKGFPLTTGEEAAVPEFASRVLGAKAGDEREATVKARDPENPDAPPRTETFRLVVREVRDKRLPAIDDELAKKIEKRSEGELGYYGSLDELKEEIRRRLGMLEEAKAKDRMAEEAIAQVLAANSFEAPDFLVDQLLDDVKIPDREVDPQIVGDREEKTRKLRQELRPRAEARVRRSLVLSAIARKEELRVAPQELAQEIRRIAAREEKRPEEIREALERAGSLGGLRERLLEEKVVHFIVDSAKVERKEPSRILTPGDE